MRNQHDLKEVPFTLWEVLDWTAFCFFSGLALGYVIGGGQ